MNKSRSTVLLIIRWVVGLLFIFSGLVKANDPLGLSYKMQEFFEAWNIAQFNGYTLALSLIMNVFEVLAGVAVIVGWRMKLFSWLLLLLIIFFSFLTGYALFSGKIKTCGCFGDCLPLTPAQSFTKDIILLVLIFILFINKNLIERNYKRTLATVWLPLAVVLTSVLQWQVLLHLPVVDCLPYKKGNNILEQMKPPANAVQDSIVMVFVYKKDGKQVEFTADKLPPDLDSTYEFVDRKDKVIRQGNAIPPIADFALYNTNGDDVTQQIFQTENYVLLLAKDMDNADKWNNEELKDFINELQKKGIRLYLVTADKTGAERILAADKNIQILICDATVIKTAARVNATYFVMGGANIINKFSYRDLDKNQTF